MSSLKHIIISFFLCTTPVLAQTVQQSGTVTRNHIPVWVASGVIGDGGSSASSPITSIGVTNNGGQGLCINSAATTPGSSWNALCFGASTTGPATISLQNFGSATPQGIQFIINGAVQGFPTIPGSSTANDFVSFASSAGNLKDSGLSTTNGITNTVLAQMPANTVKCNPTGSTANAQDCTAIPAATFGPLTGDVTSSAYVTTISNNAVTNAKAAQMPTNTIKGNNTGGTANAADLTGAQAEGILQFTQSAGTGVQYLLDKKIQDREIDPDDYGTVDRTGATDMTTLLNTTITAAKSCATAGNAVVRLRAGVYKISGTLVPKSCVTIRGDGRGKTILLTNNATPFGPPTGQQLVHFNMSGITFKESGSIPTATAMLFPNIQDSVLSNLGFTGYTSGKLMNIATSAVSTFDDSSAIWNNSNSIFNLFYDWWSDGSSIGISEAGHYGSTPTASPPNSSNVPDQVVTQNRYDNIYLWNCTSRCITFVKGADTEFLTNIFAGPSNNSAIVAQIGDDNANFPGNNYVSNIRLQVTVSIKSPATSTTVLQAGDWTYGNQIDFETDATPSALTIATAQASVTQFKFDLCGKNYTTGLIDAAGFNTNRICVSTNVGSGGGDGQSTYYRVSNGSSSAPVWGFINDTGNGIYLPVAGTMGLSKNVRIDGHIWSGTGTTPVLSACGTSPSFSLTSNDTAGQIQVGTGPPTACTITFGTAFVNTPICLFTAVGAPNAGLAITAQSNTAMTLALTGASNQKISYFCIAQPGG